MMSSTEERTNDNTEDSCWSTLPDHIVIRLLSSLTLCDRWSVSQTCSRWHSFLSCPELWKSYTYTFNKNSDKAHLLSLKYAKYMVNVSIQLDQSVAVNRKNSLKVVEYFAGLNERKLRQIQVTFTGDNPCFYGGKEFETALLMLFSSVTSSKCPFLTKVDLHDLNVIYGDNLIDHIALNHPDLQKLNIQNKLIVCRVSTPAMARLVKRCRKLKDLSFNCSSLSGELLNALAEDSRESIDHLSMQCGREEKYRNDIEASHWSAVTARHPNLTVALDFQPESPIERIPEIMKAEVPVITVQLETFMYLHNDIETAVLSHRDMLENVTMTTPVSKNLDNVNICVNRLSRECPLLKSLHVFCVLYEDTVKNILKLHPNMAKNGTYTLKSTPDPHPWRPAYHCV